MTSPTSIGLGCANSSLPCGDCRWSRGEDILINIEGAEELQVRASSILFEAACTSMQLPTRTLVEALTTICPSVSVECGEPHLADGSAFTSGVVHRFLTAADFAVPAVDDRPRRRRMVEVLHRVTVRPDVEFSFGAAVDGADFVVVSELDRYNFEVLPALHIGKIACTEPNARNPSGTSAASACPGDL